MRSSAKRSTPTRTRKKKPDAPKLSRQHKPDNMSIEDWQRELRRQYGREQSYRLVNLGEDKIFSRFEVTNPQSKNTYVVKIRGREAGDNACTCPDFTTNTLGTCKHIEYVLAKLERKPGAKSALRAGFQPAYSEIFLHYGAQREVQFRPGSECSPELARLAGEYFDATGILPRAAFACFDDFIPKAQEIDSDLQITDDALAYIAEVRDAERRQEIVREAFPKGNRSAAFKDLLKVNLYDYQREGALFAAKAGRALIADEMGLGKTVQALAAAEIMARLYGVERVLIVCPTSLKHQWQREIQRMSARTVTVIGGLRQRREVGFDASSFFKITNYDTVHSDLDLIGRWSPDLVILDEAQRIKNWSTRVARSVKRINSPYALVLTGTPLENRLEELVSIVQFVDRFRLGPTFRLLDQHQLRNEDGKVIGYKDLNDIGKTLEPVLIRRRKDEVLDQLPERIDSTIFLPMTPQQRIIHTENLEIVARIVQKWKRYKFLSEADQRRLMTALQFMRMACDSTYLVDQRNDHGPKADEALTVLEELFERQDAKAVVFSQWLRMHELLERRVTGRKWDHVLFHGGVPSQKRKGLIDRFRDDPKCRLFLSTDAGGVGLNLQFASVVFNLDLPWNPAVLEQRVGRVHRLGQKQSVRVYNFVSQGTIEEGMLGVLQFKKSVFSGVLDGGESNVFLGGTRLTKFMESVEAVTGSIPATPVDEASDSQQMAEERQPTEKPPRAGEKPTEKQPETTTVPTTPAAPITDPWSGFLQTGLALLGQLAQSARAPAATGAETPPGLAAITAPFMQRDEKTGETFVRLPMPTPQVLDQALQAVEGLLRMLKGGEGH